MWGNGKGELREKEQLGICFPKQKLSALKVPFTSILCKVINCLLMM